MASVFDKMCRICSCPADYDVFAKIPSYLHATSNESLDNSWQKPINDLLEDITGLKFTTDDELPRYICALCISYLKHAVMFREQVINNTLALKAVQLLHQQRQKGSASNANEEDKTSQLVTAQDLLYSDSREEATNMLLNNNTQQEQDKVRKKLLNNNAQSSGMTSKQHMEQQMRYLNLLFNKSCKTSKTGSKKNRRFNGSSASAGYRDDQMASGGSGADGGEEDFPTTTSSEENEDGDDETSGPNTSKMNSIFSYYEKSFEEDDIMDLDELRQYITVNNPPENFKERKCRACSRRFMFEDSYKEHMGNCIEYAFLLLIEELNRLLGIRHSKAVSPHEFVRRTIFALRKTCDWLKVNCVDTLLPDLVNRTKTNEQRQMPATQVTTSEGASTVLPGQKERAKTSSNASNFRPLCSSPSAAPETDLSEYSEPTIRPLFPTVTEPPLSLGCVYNSATPIIDNSNNILYEIERSQSRLSSELQPDFGTSPSTLSALLLQKPIAVLATSSANATDTFDFSQTLNAMPVTPMATVRSTFLQKLQDAAATPPAVAANTTPMRNTAPPTPLIQVRKDLMATPPPPMPQLAQHVGCTPPIMAGTPPMFFSARCNPCQLLFETLCDLETHNALKHNNNVGTPKTNRNNGGVDLEAERRRIIALFEEDDF